MSEILLDKFLDVFKTNILPLTNKGVESGNKIFGAALLKKNDLSTVLIGTNNEIVNPLYHGEISTIFQYFNLNLNKQIKPSECIFLSTHEPCSLCLSAITWSGFDNFYYFFPYSETKDKFNIPHDLNILKEIFMLDNGNYNKHNNYWKSYSIINEIKKLNYSEKYQIDDNINKIYQEYDLLSQLYQKNKITNEIPFD